MRTGERWMKVYIIKYKLMGFGIYKDEEHTLYYDENQRYDFLKTYYELKDKLNIKDIKTYESESFTETVIA